jgi:tetratricopeptide (TPR) repeat protein
MGIYEHLGGDDPGRQSALANVYNGLGSVYRQTGRFPLAADAYNKALAVRKRLAREHPSEPDYQTDLAMSHYDLGDLYGATGQPDKAEQAYQDALGIQEQLARDHPLMAEYQGAVAATLNNLGGIYRSEGENEQAIKTLSRALGLWELLTRSQPARTDFAVGFGESTCALGDLVDAAQNPTATLDWFGKAIAALQAQRKQSNGEQSAQHQLSETYAGRARLLGRLADTRMRCGIGKGHVKPPTRMSGRPCGWPVHGRKPTRETTREPPPRQTQR